MTIELRGGYETTDARLGRVPSFDDRSREYDIKDVLPAKAKVRGHTWPIGIHLDQGNSSACTGFSRAYDLAGQPSIVKDPDTGDPLDNTYAQFLYREAQRHDEWAGTRYEGSSVLGALKACVALGFIGEYRWAFDIDDMILALSHVGPVVVGTVWYNSMFEPAENGLLEVDPKSDIAGGHAWCIRGVISDDKYKAELLGKGQNRKGEALFRMRNSWGESWGVNSGEAFLWAADYHEHLWEDGEQSVVTEAFYL